MAEWKMKMLMKMVEKNSKLKNFNEKIIFRISKIMNCEDEFSRKMGIMSMKEMIKDFFKDILQTTFSKLRSKSIDIIAEKASEFILQNAISALTANMKMVNVNDSEKDDEEFDEPDELDEPEKYEESPFECPDCKGILGSYDEKENFRCSDCNTIIHQGKIRKISEADLIKLMKKDG